MASVSSFKKVRSVHNTAKGKLRDARRDTAIRMAVHLLSGGTSDKWVLADSKSTITFNSPKGARIYSLAKSTSQINEVVAERKEAADKKAADEAETAAKKTAEAVAVVADVDMPGPTA